MTDETQNTDPTEEGATIANADTGGETPEVTPPEIPAADPEPEVEEGTETPTAAAAEPTIADVEPAPDAEDAVAEAEAPTPAEPKRKRKRLPRPQRRQRPKVARERPAQRKPIVRGAKPEQERGRRQERRGVVVSAAMDKTIVVKVDTIKAHQKYKKVVKRSTKFHAHDERNEAKVGDVVRIVETRPVSKTKHWRLAEILEQAR